MLRLPIGVADSNERKATRNTLLVEREILAAQKLVERARLIGPHRAVHGDTARHVLAKMLVPVSAPIRCRDQLVDNRASRDLVRLQCRRDVAALVAQRLCEGDRVLEREARARSDREVRGMQRVADEDAVAD